MATHHTNWLLNLGGKGFLDMKEAVTSCEVEALEVWLEISKLKPCPIFNFPITGISIVPFVFIFVNQKKVLKLEILQLQRREK